MHASRPTYRWVSLASLALTSLIAAAVFMFGTVLHDRTARLAGGFIDFVSDHLGGVAIVSGIVVLLAWLAIGACCYLERRTEVRQ